MTVFRKDVANPEGPVATKNGDWFITEMNRGIVSRVSSDGQESTVIVRTGRPNGLALDLKEQLWIAESKHPSLMRLDVDGELSVVSMGTEQYPFLWPNDLCCGPDGWIYMTDSGVLLEHMEAADPPSAVYRIPVDGKLFRIDPESGRCEMIDRGLRFANGIAFGPGARYLYVNETLTGNVYRYRLEDMTSDRELFCNVMLKASGNYGRIAGPDGMAFDIEGSLYVAVLTEGYIAVVDSDGVVTERIDVPGEFPTNVAFSVNEENVMLVTEGSGNQLLKYKTRCIGLPLLM